MAPPNSSTKAVANNATLRTSVIKLRAASPLRLKWDSAPSVTTVAGTLPVASRPTTRQSMLRAKPCTRLPPVLVAAA